MGSSCTIQAIPNETLQQDNSNLISSEADSDNQVKTKRKVLKISMLLLGPAESGKSTLLKQMKALYVNGFSAKERLSFISIIRQNLLVIIMTILKEMEELKIIFSEEDSEKNATRFEQLSETLEAKTDINEKLLTEMRSIIRDLLGDKGVQECISRDFEYYNLDSSRYFLDRSSDIMACDYLPNNDDIVRARKISTSMEEITFTKKMKKSDMVVNLIDVGGQRSERKKWALIFRTVQAVIFVASLIEFDQVLEEDGLTNRFQETLKLFNQVSGHSLLEKTMMMVFLNKRDTLERKINQLSFKGFFPDFQGNEKDMSDVIEYIRSKLEEKAGNRRQIYSHVTCATDPDNVDFVFNAVNDRIIYLSMKSIGLQ